MLSETTERARYQDLASLSSLSALQVCTAGTLGWCMQQHCAVPGMRLAGASLLLTMPCPTFSAPGAATGCAWVAAGACMKINTCRGLHN